jgi:hypothetical protein
MDDDQTTQPINERDFMDWLEDRTVAELHEAGDDIHKQKQVFRRYFERGDAEGVSWAALWDYLSISHGNPLQRAGLYDDDQLFEATLAIITEAAQEVTHATQTARLSSSSENNQA